MRQLFFLTEPQPFTSMHMTALASSVCWSIILKCDNSFFLFDFLPDKLLIITCSCNTWWVLYRYLLNFFLYKNIYEQSTLTTYSFHTDLSDVTYAKTYKQSTLTTYSFNTDQSCRTYVKTINIMQTWISNSQIIITSLIILNNFYLHTVLRHERLYHSKVRGYNVKYNKKQRTRSDVNRQCWSRKQ